MISLVQIWISNSLSSKNKVPVVGDLKHLWWVSFGRSRDPPYFITMYLVSSL